MSSNGVDAIDSCMAANSIIEFIFILLRRYRYNVAWSSVDAFVYGRYMHINIVCCLMLCSDCIFFHLFLEQCMLQRHSYVAACISGCQVFDFTLSSLKWLMCSSKFQPHVNVVTSPV